MAPPKAYVGIELGHLTFKVFFFVFKVYVVLNLVSFEEKTTKALSCVGNLGKTYVAGGFTANPNVQPMRG